MGEDTYDLQRHIREVMSDVLATIPRESRAAVSRSVSALIEAHGGSFPTQAVAFYDMDGDPVIFGDGFQADTETSLCQAAYQVGEWDGWSAEVWESNVQPVQDIRGPNGLHIDTRIKSRQTSVSFEARLDMRTVRITLEDSAAEPELVMDVLRLMESAAERHVPD